MKNRIPTHAGRIRLIPVSDEPNMFDLTRADEPIQEGTPINKQLLDYAIAANGVTSGTATDFTLDDKMGGFTLVDGARINFRLHVSNQGNATINVSGTGAKPLLTMRGLPIPAGFAEGAWITAVYSAAMDAYIMNGGGDISPTIIVSVYDEADVICTDGVTTIHALKNGNKTHTLYVPYLGKWTVIADIEGDQESKVVTVSDLTTYTVSLSFFNSILRNNTWKRIALATKMGLANKFWKVGDRRYISDDEAYTDIPYEVYILGFNHNGTENTIDFGTFYNTETSQDWSLYKSSYRMGNVGSWRDSNMRYTVLGSTDDANGGDASETTATTPVPNTIMAQFPEELRAVMKPMQIYTYSHDTSDISLTVDYLPLLSAFEAGGDSVSNRVPEIEIEHQAQYDYFKNGNSIIKYNTDENSYWTRSPYSFASGSFITIQSNGSLFESSGGNSKGVAPIFRV